MNDVFFSKILFRYFVAAFFLSFSFILNYSFQAFGRKEEQAALKRNDGTTTITLFGACCQSKVNGSLGGESYKKGQKSSPFGRYVMWCCRKWLFEQVPKRNSFADNCVALVLYQRTFQCDVISHSKYLNIFCTLNLKSRPFAHFILSKTNGRVLQKVLVAWENEITRNL